MEKITGSISEDNIVKQVSPGRKLHSLQLKDGEPVHGHIKAMMELFDELAIVGDVIQDEDCVTYLQQC